MTQLRKAVLTGCLQSARLKAKGSSMGSGARAGAKTKKFPCLRGLLSL